MRKSLITTAVLGALASSSLALADEAKSDIEVAYNVGLYSQYIFRGLTQTDKMPALQGGVDITHSSGFYLGAWGSNISWARAKYGPGTTDSSESFYSKGGNLEMDIYGGFRTELSGIGIDLGALQYYYPGTETGRGTGAGYAKINTTELYGAINYKWAQAKISGVVSKDAWGWGKIGSPATGDDGRGAYYAELNFNPPISELLGVKDGLASGVTGIIHIARQEFPDSLDYASYTDYKLGLQKAFDSGVNVGAYWTKANTKDSAWTYDGRNIGDSTGTAYIQKTF